MDLANIYSYFHPMWPQPPRPAIEHFDGYLPRKVQAKLQASSTGMYTKKRLPNGKVQVTGGKRLRASGAYPSGFGRKVASMFLKNRKVLG